VGCVRVNGHFQRGELIAIVNSEGKEIARGLSNYSSAEAEKILRCHANEIATKLGYAHEDELVHRDNMAHW
jgi:glutamate 5-kinase